MATKQEYKKNSINTKKKRKSVVKISRNHSCLTVEFPKNTSNTFDYKTKLTNNEIKNIQIRKDKTSFLLYCTNCLLPGHNAYKCTNRYSICVAGDSHTAYWGTSSRFYINTNIVRIRIPGMTAQGLINQNSYLQAASKIIAAFKNCHNGNSKYLFLQIGQVDIDYVWYFKQMKYKNQLNFNDQIKLSINNLFKFINNNLLNILNQNNNYNIKLIIHGIHLPPLNNIDMKDKLYNHFINRSDLNRKYLDKYLILPTHKERTQMVLKFNNELKKECIKNKFLFVQIAEDIIDKNTKIVNTKYIKNDNNNIKDIHLDPKSLIPIYHNKFKNIMKLEFAAEIDNIWNKLESFQSDLKQRLLNDNNNNRNQNRNKIKRSTSRCKSRSRSRSRSPSELKNAIQNAIKNDKTNKTNNCQLI